MTFSFGYISADLFLMASVLALYLYDRSECVFCNEGFLFVGNRQKKIIFSYSFLSFRGKELTLLNPFLFYAPLFRFSWSFEASLAKSRSCAMSWTPPVFPLFGFRMALFGIFFSLFILLPIGLFTPYQNAFLSVFLCLLYASLLFLLFCIWRHRSFFSLSKKAFWVYAFELLICPPFSLNALMRLTSKKTQAVDFRHIALACRSSNPHVLNAFLKRQEEEMSLEAENTLRFARLKAVYQELLALNHHGII